MAADNRKRALDALKGLRQAAARARMGDGDAPGLTVTLGLEEPAAKDEEPDEKEED